MKAVLNWREEKAARNAGKELKGLCAEKVLKKLPTSSTKKYNVNGI